MATFSEFCEACEKGNLKKVQQFIEKGYDVNKEHLGTALIYAAGEGRLDIVSYLINLGADVNKKNRFDQTALHYASENDHLTMVELLLSKGAEIDVEDKNHRTPLMLAVKNGHNDVLMHLINHGADVNKKYWFDQTALHYASENGHLKIVELLLSKGAEIDAEDKNHHTSLMLAVEYGHNDVSMHLINHGVDVNKKYRFDQTALHYASERGHLKMVELLLSKGAEIDAEDKNHHTPLMLAVKNGHNDASMHLINRGADVGSISVFQRTTLLSYASENGHLRVVELLLSEGAEIDAEDKNHHTPLMLAVKNGHNDVSMHLINHGVDVNKKYRFDQTALHYASENGHLKMVELLLSKGAEIDAEDKNHRTPLLLAVKNGHNDVLLYLINHGVDVNKKYWFDQTALHYASERGHLKMVELLLSKGAEIDAEDKNHCTPLMLAVKNGHNDVSMHLINHGVDVNKKYRFDQTALHYASENGHLKMVELLLSKGAEIDAEDKNHHTPLMLAVKNGHNDVSMHLINHGADVGNISVFWRTTLLSPASKNGHLRVVELLLSKGAEIDVEDEFSRTPLMLAVEYGHNDVSMYLINHGADFSKIGGFCQRKLLNYASENGYLRVVESLLSKGVINDVEDKNLHTPLMLAAENGHNDISMYLINHGADVRRIDDFWQTTLLSYASENGHLRVVELLLSEGAEIDAEDKNHHTPLMLAVKNGHNDVSMHLINHGADVSKKDVQERTALHYASERGHLKVVEVLLRVGAKIDLEDKDRHTPLMLAYECQMFDVVCRLITAGASVERLSHYNDVNREREALSYIIKNNHIAEASVLITNGIGIEGELDINPPRTALMWFAEKGHDSLVMQLILQGVDVNYQDINDDTALHFAARYKHIQCGILLVEAGADVRLVNRASATPLDIASKGFKDAIIQTLSFNTRKTVCVIGNAYSGKSTLIASLKNENANVWTKAYHWLFGVKNISERTAGIEPVSLSSKRYGDVVFLDFAGQHEYHGPHEMFLESILSKSRSTVTIIVVVKVTEKESTIFEQLDRWLHPVSKISPSTNPIRVIVIGSHMDMVKSKPAAKEKLERCYERVRQSLCDVPLEFHDACYLDCRQPYSSDIGKLCTYLNEVPIPEYKATKMPYSICWVISRMKASLDNKAIQVADFSDWIEGNKANLPTNLPPAEEVCKDLMSTGHFLYLPNKEEPSNGWLILDLPSILHEVYGTLFSPSKKIVNKFGVLNCQELSNLFPTLDDRMVHDVLISLEFCIEVDSSILVEVVTQLTESTDEGREHLFFPALVLSQPSKFTNSQRGYHTLSWQLLVNKKPFISPRLLQTIILRLAAHHVFHYKRGLNTREHYCSVWSTGILWQSTKDVDMAVQITDNTVVEVIGRSEVGPEALCSYISTITQDIFATIRELSPTLSATAYIIHPADPQVLLENPRSPAPQEMFPVEFILESARNAGSTCLSCEAENETATRKQISELFSGFVPTEEVIQKLSSVTSEFVHVHLYLCEEHCYCIVL